MDAHNLIPEDLLPELEHEPRDFRTAWPEANVEGADQAVYRVGLTALPVPGLPETLSVGHVSVRFVRGPILAQRTRLRQRHAIPFRFEKHMERRLVGHGDLLALLSIGPTPVPDAIESAILDWRSDALAAVGLIASMLDERIAGDELFEDVVLLRAGEPIGALDMKSGVRTFMPFDVNSADRAALAQLEDLVLPERPDLCRAARLYRRAAVEGPTADAYAMLWVAAEALSSHDTPSRKDIEAKLVSAGLDPSGLPLHVGLLIDLRAKVQHRGVEEHERLRMAYYEMEAVVRCLIREVLGISGGWWPASDNPAAFTDPFDGAVAAVLGPGETEWFDQGLPPLQEPSPLNLPRRVPKPLDDPRIAVDDAFGMHREFIANVVIDALEWQDPNATLEVHLGLPADAPAGAFSLARATGIYISPEQLDGLDDAARPQVLVNLVWGLYSLVGSAIAQQAGAVSEGLGTVLVEAFGAWGQYRRLVAYGDLDSSLIQIPQGDDPLSVGKIVGWAAAGHSDSVDAVSELTGETGAFARELVSLLEAQAPGAPVSVVDAARAHRPTAGG